MKKLIVLLTMLCASLSHAFSVDASVFFDGKEKQEIVEMFNSAAGRHSDMYVATPGTRADLSYLIHIIQLPVTKSYIVNIAWITPNPMYFDLVNQGMEHNKAVHFANTHYEYVSSYLGHSPNFAGLESIIGDAVAASIASYLKVVNDYKQDYTQPKVTY